LDIAKEGTLKTQIMYRANMSFAQLNEYLTFMLKIQLLNKFVDNGKDVYAVTPKGREFSHKYGELAGLLVEEANSKNGVKLPPQILLSSSNGYF
jgi:predicted transcriptional regulator